MEGKRRDSEARIGVSQPPTGTLVGPRPGKKLDKYQRAAIDIQQQRIRDQEFLAAVASKHLQI